MKITLKKGLDAEQSKSLDQSWKEGLVFRRALYKWADAQISSTVKDMTKKEAFGTANWGFSQANQVAYIRAMEDIKSIILASEEVP